MRGTCFLYTILIITRLFSNNILTMHIIEGMLSPPILAGGAAIALAGNIFALNKLKNETIMTTALLSSAFFVVSLIHIPIGFISIHLLLNGLLGLILGTACIPAITVALLLQTLLFQHGGITVLGVNIIILAGPALFVHLIFNSWLNQPGKSKMLGGFLAGAAAPLLSIILVAFSLAGSDDYYFTTGFLLVCIHVPVMIIEGIITMYSINFLSRVQPEILFCTKKIL